MIILARTRFGGAGQRDRPSDVEMAMADKPRADIKMAVARFHGRASLVRRRIDSSCRRSANDRLIRKILGMPVPLGVGDGPPKIYRQAARLFGYQCVR